MGHAISMTYNQEVSTSLLSFSMRGQTEWKPQSQKTNWSLGSQCCLTQWNYEPCHAGTPKTDGVMVESIEEMWSGREGNGKPLQYSCLEKPMNTVKRQKDMTLKDVDMTGDGSKVWCYKEQYCVSTWNVRFMNQGKLEVVKQEMARVNIDILGICEWKWTGMGEFN